MAVIMAGLFDFVIIFGKGKLSIPTLKSQRLKVSSVKRKEVMYCV